MNALLTLLNLNNPSADITTNPLTNSAKPAQVGGKISVPQGPPIWKVLVLDQYTKDVLATVLRVQDLRDAGVTLHVYVSMYRVIAPAALIVSQSITLDSTTTTRCTRCLLRVPELGQHKANSI